MSLRPLGLYSFALAAVLAVAVAAPPALAQAPRPGQLPPGPGPGGPRGPAQPAAPPPGQPGQPGQIAPPRPYKEIAVTPPAPTNDPSFGAFRKQLADIAARKDRAGLARLVVPTNFFWLGEKGDKANKRKSGIDNLAEALNLDAREGFGWEELSQIADENTLEAIPERRGVSCSPASPKFDEKAAEQLAKATGTDPSEWAYPAKPGVEVRAAAQPNAQVIGTLGMYLVRVIPDQPPGGPGQPPGGPGQPPGPQSGAQSTYLRVVTPAGKLGFVLADVLVPLEVDQLCYVKDATGGWKIAGVATGN